MAFGLDHPKQKKRDCTHFARPARRPALVSSEGTKIMHSRPFGAREMTAAADPANRRGWRLRHMGKNVKFTSPAVAIAAPPSRPSSQDDEGHSRAARPEVAEASSFANLVHERGLGVHQVLGKSAAVRRHFPPPKMPDARTFNISRHARPLLLAAFGAWLSPAVPAMAGPDQDAAVFTKAVAGLNEAHARNPGAATEAELGKKLPATARSALRRLIEARPSPGAADALASCGEAALDLDLINDFQTIRKRLAEVAPERTASLGFAVSRPRFLVRGIGGLEDTYLDGFADVFDAILVAYDEVFGFKEWSKVPGKKLRVRVHLESEISRPPHFAPQFPWHSEIDFPVIDANELRSPTAKGHFLFYGLCHELGHVIAMWGDQQSMEDHHAWAHYTGVVIVEHLAKSASDKPFMKSLGDVRWRSLTLERQLPENKIEPSVAGKPGVMALLIRLHDEAGPKAIGTPSTSWTSATAPAASITSAITRSPISKKRLSLSFPTRKRRSWSTRCFAEFRHSAQIHARRMPRQCSKFRVVAQSLMRLARNSRSEVRVARDSAFRK